MLFIYYLSLSLSFSLIFCLSLSLSFSQRCYQGFFASLLHLPTVSTLGFYECCLSREMIEIDHMKIRKHVCSVYSWNPYVCRIYQNAAISGVRLQQLGKHEFCCPIANIIFIISESKKNHTYLHQRGKKWWILTNPYFLKAYFCFSHLRFWKCINKTITYIAGVKSLARVFLYICV